MRVEDGEDGGDRLGMGITRCGEREKREEITYDGVKEEMSIMGVADANAARSGLLRSHSWRGH